MTSHQPTPSKHRILRAVPPRLRNTKRVPSYTGASSWELHRAMSPSMPLRKVRSVHPKPRELGGMGDKDHLVLDNLIFRAGEIPALLVQE